MTIVINPPYLNNDSNAGNSILFQNFSKCIGVELLADLHGEATAASQLLVVAEGER